jgi:hypothetical protein
MKSCLHTVLRMSRPQIVIILLIPFYSCASSCSAAGSQGSTPRDFRKSSINICRLFVALHVSVLVPCAPSEGSHCICHSVCQFLEVGGSVNFELLSCLTLNVEQKAFSSIPRAGGAAPFGFLRVLNQKLCLERDVTYQVLEEGSAQD